MSDNKSNKIYLVTGAAGFLGGEICRQLIEQGRRVRGFILPNDPARKYIPQEVEIIEGDLTDIKSLKPFFDTSGTEAIVLHIASIVTSSPDYNPKVIEVNVGGTKNIIDMCLCTPSVKKLVYCSSTGAIPEQPKGTPIREIDYFDETKVPGCYEYAAKGIRVVSVSPGLIETGMGTQEVEQSDFARQMIKQTCEHRMGKPEELGFAIATIADERNGYLSGVDVLIDGGASTGRKS